jgi:hypothetical protein
MGTKMVENPTAQSKKCELFSENKSKNPVEKFLYFAFRVL